MSMEEQGPVGHGGGHTSANPTVQPSNVTNVVGNTATHVLSSSSLMPSLRPQHATNADQVRYHGTDASASSTSQGLGQPVNVGGAREGQMSVNLTAQQSGATSLVRNNDYHVESSSSSLYPHGSQHALYANQVQYYGVTNSASSTSRRLGQLIDMEEQGPVGHGGGQMGVNPTVQPSNMVNVVGFNTTHVQDSSSLMRPLGSQETMNFNQFHHHVRSSLETFLRSWNQMTSPGSQYVSNADQLPTYAEEFEQILECLYGMFQNVSTLSNATPSQGSQHVVETNQRAESDAIHSVLEPASSMLPQESNYSTQHPPRVFLPSRSQHVFTNAIQRMGTGEMNSIPASSTLPQPPDGSMQNPPDLQSFSGSQQTFTNANQDHYDGTDTLTNFEHTPHRTTGEDLTGPPTKQMRMTPSASVQSSSQTSRSLNVAHSNQDNGNGMETLTNFEHTPHQSTGEDLTRPPTKQMRMTRSASQQSSQTSRSLNVAHSNQVAEPVIQNTPSPLKKPAATEEELSNLLSLDDEALSAIASGHPKRISKRKVDACQERVLNYPVADILKQTMEKSLIRQYTWNGYSRLGPKKMFKDSNAHKLLKRVLEIKGFANAGDEDVGKAVRYAIRISGDWNGGRTDRRKEKKGKERRENKNPAPTQVENDVTSQSSDHQVASEAEVSSQEISSKENATASITPVSATDATPGATKAISQLEEAFPLQSSDNRTTHESSSEDEDEADLIQGSDDEITDESLSETEEEADLTQSSDDEIMHGKFDELVADGNFREAITLLESHPMTELQQMKLFQCYSRIEDFEKTLEIIENVKTLMAQTRRFTADNLCKIARRFRGIERIFLHICAGKLYLFEADPNDGVRGIKECSRKCMFKIRNQNRRFFDKVGLKIMKDFICDVTSVENADPDVKTDCLASCLCDTGWCYYNLARDLNYTGELYVKLKMYDEGKGYYERGIDAMRKHFGSNSSKQYVFGELSMHMGDLHCDLGEYSEARTFYQQAIEAYHDANIEWSTRYVKAKESLSAIKVEDPLRIKIDYLLQSSDYTNESLSAIEVEADLIQSSDDRITHAKYDALVKVGKFREAITLLESHPKTELQQFRLLKCYSREEDLKKTLEIIQSMKTLMTETRRFTADDLCKLAEKIFARSYHKEMDELDLYSEENVHNNVQHISFYVCASKLYLFEADPDDEIRGIKKCLLECYKHLPCFTLHWWTTVIGLEVIDEFIDDMTSVEDANPDVKTEMLVWCLSHTGRCHVKFERYDKGKGYYERGIDVMRKRFGSDSSKHKVFGELLHRMGNANRYLGQYLEARTFYQQAIEAYESAEDMNEGWDRQWSIDKVKGSFSKIEIAVFLLRSSDDRVTHGKYDALVRILLFQEAITFLESHPKTELQQMKLFECYSKIRDFEKSLEIIKNMKIKNMMAETRRFTAVDLCKLAEKKKSERSIFNEVECIGLKCIFLYACASKLYLFEADPNDRVCGIKRCSDGVFAVITHLAEQFDWERDFANKVGVKIMKELIDDVTSVEDVDPDVKTEMLAWCLCNTGRCCVELEMYAEGKEYCERGIDVMRKRFGFNSSKYEVFGELLSNMGDVNRGLGDYLEARTFYQQAIEAYEAAEDVNEGWDRQRSIDKVKGSLSKIQIAVFLLRSSDDRVTHGKFDTLVRNFDYREPSTLLESHPTTELQQIKLFQYYSRSLNFEKSLENIENLKMLVAQTRRFTADDLRKLAEKSVTKISCSLKCIPLYASASKLYVFEADPNDRVRGIKRCSDGGYTVITHLDDLFPWKFLFARKVGVKIMKDFIDDVTSVENADPDVTTEMLAWCLCNTGRCCVKFKMYDEGKEYCQRGIDVMRKRFGSDASKYRVFSELSHNMGNANHGLGGYSEARTFYQQAIEAYESAEEEDEGWDRQRSIDKVKESLSEIEIEAFLQSSDDRITHGKCDALVKNWKFRRAITLLESHPKTELQQMKLFQCYSEIENFEKSLEIIENMKTLMTQTRRFTADDLCELVEERSKREAYYKFQCIPLYACASKLYLFEADPNDRVRGIKRCSGGGFAVITYLAELIDRKRRFANKVGVKIMKDFIDDVTSVENTDPDVKTEMLAWCLCNTGRCCVELEMYDEGKEYCERGIDVMTKRFGSDSSKFEVFSELSHNMAIPNR